MEHVVIIQTGSQYSNYEEVFEDVKKDADQKCIPYRYVQVKKQQHFFDHYEFMR